MNHTGMDPLEALLGPFPCARVRGLPYEATPEDVLVFFQGLVVIDVVLLMPTQEDSSGEAYVVFANPMDFQMGLQRDRQNMGNRYLEIFQGKRSDYYAAIASQQHWHGANLGGVVTNDNAGGLGLGGGQKATMGIPGIDDKPNFFDATAEPFTAGDTTWGKTDSSSAQGSNNNAQKGRGGPPGGSNMGGQSYGAQGNNYGRGGGAQHKPYGGRGNFKRNYQRGGNAGSGPGGHHHGGGLREGPHTGYLRLRGLPYQASKQDVLDFFKDYGPVQDSVLLTHRADGRSTGEGYVMFADADDASAAMEKHRSTIGSRYIELFISNKEEHTRNVARSQPR